MVPISVSATGGCRQVMPGPQMGLGDTVTKHGGIVPDNPKYRLDRWKKEKKFTALGGEPVPTLGGALLKQQLLHGPAIEGIHWGVPCLA